MCGIFGYTGSAEAADLLIEGLSKLEYRGYDSAGISVLNGDIHTLKSAGNIAKLRERRSSVDVSGTSGIAHTRWATHGEPNETNSHPHHSNSNRYSLVHNGIIENYLEMKKDLIDKGFDFKSDTDTEVLVNYIEHLANETGKQPADLMPEILRDVKGSFAIALMDTKNPGVLIAARKGSPLIIGLDGNEQYLSSDPLALAQHCDSAIYLENRHYAVIAPGKKPAVYNERGLEIVAEVAVIDQMKDQITVDKGDFSHYTLKEIYEQPDIARQHVAESFQNHHILPELTHLKKELVAAKRLVVIGCGTSLHAGWMGRNYIERLAGIPVVVEQASEFRYGEPLLFENDIVIAVSQSGETADTMEGVRLVSSIRDLPVIGLCNVKGSTLYREASACLMLNAGPEIGVASTKAFMSQVLMFFRLAMHLADLKGYNAHEGLLDDFKKLPNLIEKTLKFNEATHEIAEKYKDSENMLFLGRGIQFPIAMEGALKVKELSYIHAEGYSSAEMKHGPLALIDEKFPTVVVATDSEQEGKNINTVKEISSRKGKVIALVQESSTRLANEADDYLMVPDIHDMLAPFLATIPLQLLSFHFAVLRGHNVDQPRNLAKSVTVE